MAQEMINEVVKTVVEFVFKEIGLQFGYLLHYKRNIDSLTEEVRKLENEQAGVQGRVDAEIRNNRVMLPIVEEWMERVNNVKNETQQFLQNEVKENQTCFKWWMCPDLASRYKVSRRASKKKISVDGLMNECKSFNEVANPAPPPSAAARFGDHAEDFESRRAISDGILKALEDDQVKIIGVYGMGGVGKTTLVKEIAKKVEEQKSFVETALATVSLVPDVSNIQHEIAQQLGLDLKKENESSQAGNLSQRLEQSKGRVLLILDDLWDTLELGKIGIHPSESCKVILTSRDRNVCTKMNSDRKFEIEILSQGEGLSLFLKEVGLIADSQGLPPMVHEIVAKCQGLPLAIRAIAKALKGEGPDSWTLAHRHIQKSTPEEIEGMTKEVYSVLECSFTFLKKEERTCFLACRFFKEDTDIPIEDVMRYAVGLRILGDVDSIEEARITTHVLIEKLKARCLLLGAYRDDFIRMHDVFRDFANFMASTGEHGYKFLLKEGKSANVWPDVSKLTNCTAISLLDSGIGELPERVDCPKLELFKFEGKYGSRVQLPTDFFVNMPELKVLEVKYMSIASLNISITFSSKLQTLHLNQCSLTGNISFIGELKNLKILTIYGCDIEELPKEFGQLTQLMILDLTTCWKVHVVPPNLISRLTRLECLHMSHCRVEWGEGNNASLDELKHLSCLKMLEIQIQKVSQFPGDYDVEKLKLTMFRVCVGLCYGWFDCKWGLYMEDVCLQEGVDLPAGIKTLVRRAQFLELRRCGVLNSVLDTLKRHGFANLRYFKVDRCWAEKGDEDIDLGLCECSELIELNIFWVSGLIRLWKESASYAFLENLKFVSIDGRSRLKSLFPWPASKHLQQLQKLIVTDVSVDEVFVKDVDDELVLPCLRNLELCTPSLRSFCADRNNSFPSPCFFDGKLKLPALEFVRLYNMPMVKELCSSQLPSETFCELKYLELLGCRSFVKLLPSNIISRLNKLEEIKIEHCNSVEVAEITRLIGAEGGPADSLSTFEPISLHLVDLPQLTEFWWNKEAKENFSFRYPVRRLKLTDFNDGRNLFVPSAINNHFNHLVELDIHHCVNLEEVVVAAIEEQGGFSVEFSCVKILSFWRLPKLRSFCSSENCTFTWPSLEIVTMEHCPNVEIFCSGTLYTPKLNRISIDYIKWDGDLNKAIQDSFQRRMSGEVEDEGK